MFFMNYIQSYYYFAHNFPKLRKYSTVNSTLKFESKTLSHFFYVNPLHHSIHENYNSIHAHRKIHRNIPSIFHKIQFKIPTSSSVIFHIHR